MRLAQFYEPVFIGDRMPPSTKRNWVQVFCIATVIILVILIIGVICKKIVHGDKFTLNDTVPIQSTVDGMIYRVHTNFSDAQEAANKLAKINLTIIKLLKHLKKKYPQTETRYPERVRAVAALLKRYNPDNLAENSPLDPAGDTSYTLDKGGLIALCLREKNDSTNAKIHGDKALVFVAIHEIAHIAIDDVNHPPRFWSAFKFLLMEAEEIGILVDAHFARFPTVYCGLKIDFNPLYDKATIPIY